MSNPGERKRLTWEGIYRAKVIDSKDPKKEGRVKVWCPDTMPEIDPTMGLWARPGNNVLGGRNTIDNTDPTTGQQHYYQGSCYIPPVGSYVFIFFEYGNPNEPRYLGAADLATSRVPIENQQGDDYDKKWTIIKTRQGRTILVSDDEYDCRVEITGKKRLLSGDDPAGNPESVYTVNSNQTVILLDERDGQEKILIKDYKGNYINFKTQDNTLNAYFAGDIQIQSGGSINLTCSKDVNIAATGKINIDSKNDMNLKSTLQMKIMAEQQVSVKCNASDVAIDGLNTQIQTGLALIATGATSASPDGNRNEPTATIEPLSIVDIPNDDTIPKTIVFPEMQQ